MCRQCIIDYWGGHVKFAGEILHGKTSILKHDRKGIYLGLPQNLLVTRYHSLAGTRQTMPDCLDVTSWVNANDGRGEDIIMGVRHRDFLVEGVQFHPESILTECGHFIFKNFLHFRGGTWAENIRLQNEADSKNENFLSTIFAHRKVSVAAQKQIPSQTPADLQAIYELDLAPPLISFVDRLRKSPFPLSLMAEIKRASPSKGIISMSINAPAQARSYAMAGASVISVLTEPEWFKGSIDDLRNVRKALEGMKNRPAILRKDFICSEYQVLEARLAGADTVLLIVKMLDEKTLRRLYHYSQSLGMEPLVEVNTAEEMLTAKKLGSKVIGINNRNLTNFQVDLDTTSRLIDQVAESKIVCALSGIRNAKDIQSYLKNGVRAILVGEALMRSENHTELVRELFGECELPVKSVPKPLLVKVCGTRKAEVAAEAIKAGANMIGIILVPERSRRVSHEDAMKISEVVHMSRLSTNSCNETAFVKTSETQASDFFANSIDQISSNYPHLVGVFQNQPLEEILRLQKLYRLNIVQLHGDEPIEWANLIPVPVIRSFTPCQSGIGKRGYHVLPLLDSGAGGSGNRLNMYQVQSILRKDNDIRILLAGGLNPDNVEDTVLQAGQLRERIVGVDVSSGIEENGVQSISKIEAFIKAAKRIR